MADQLIIRGAREHNLKDVSIDLPRDSLIVFTGLSGSGKSSLAFDTIFAEGQRRYVESLSAYARQFLGQMDKPDVDFIEGLSPAVSIDQKSTSKNPRSTVGTITEVYDYLRLLYARIGHELRVAAMVDLVGDDVSLDARRLASLQRSVRATFPRAADYDRATPWAGLRPATPSGAPINGNVKPAASASMLVAMASSSSTFRLNAAASSSGSSSSSPCQASHSIFPPIPPSSTNAIQ